MKKKCSKLVVFLLLSFIVGCSKVNSLENAEIKTKNESLEQFITNDNKITFKIYNQGYFPTTKLKQLQDEVLVYYDEIKDLMEVNYKRPESINIYLYKGSGRSSASKTDIILYDFDRNIHALTHELTHVLYGAGNNFGYEYGALTQEGFAVYTQSNFGQPSFPNMDIPVHHLMKYFIDIKKVVPIYDLIDQATTQKLVFSSTKNATDEARVWIAYIQAGSFVTYLIEEYGLEKFKNIYNQPDIAAQAEIVYHKSFHELEEEWHQYIMNHFDSPTQASINKYFRYYNEVIDDIEESIFKEK